MMTRVFFTGCFLVVIRIGLALGYDDQTSHPQITETAIRNASSLNSYMEKSLGFEKGFSSRFPSNSQNPKTSALELLKKGSTDEDDPLCRATNHFHNPMKPWDRAGITSISWPLCPTWDITSYSTRYSTLTWATGYDSPTGLVVDRSKQDMGWDKAREYYYAALTSKTKIVREDYFAKTFQAVGQVMHLLQDMAVPAHVRNDFWNSHVWTGGSNPYELYVKKDTNIITKLSKDQIDKVVPAFTAPKTTDFWDTTYYTSPTILDPEFQRKAGLAEYTNANFVSEGTLFSNSTVTEYPYPQKSSTEQVVHDISDPFIPGATVKRPYYYKTKDWEVNYHLAGVNYTLFYMPESSSPSPDIIIPPLDRYVHEDYARFLLPRAVGYSAALIDYFFRGQLGVSLVPGGMKVKNLSDETMYSDTIGVYYDDTNNVRHPLQTYNMASTPLAPGQATPVISFNIPADPPNIKDSRYIVVFKGKLGNEEDAVIGNVSSPTLYYLADVNGIEKIMRISTAGGDPTVVYDTKDPNLFFGRVSPSPDGKTLVYVIYSPEDEYNGKIYKLDLATGSSAFLTTGNAPDVSPDGEKIVFSRELGNLGDSANEPIFTRDLVTNTETQLTTAMYSEHIEPVWSPDGTKIAYSRFNTGGINCSNAYTINVMSSDGTGDRVITCKTAGISYDREPAWSPDGSEIAFARGVVKLSGESAFQLYKVNVETGQEIQLITDPGWTNCDQYSPAWSPDGRTIAFFSSTCNGVDYDVWLVSAFGGGSLLNLTNVDGASDLFPIFGR